MGKKELNLADYVVSVLCDYCDECEDKDKDKTGYSFCCCPIQNLIDTLNEKLEKHGYR